MIRKIKNFFFPGKFSGREAFWIAILLHLLFLVVPQSILPSNFFISEIMPVEPEPLQFSFKQPEEQIEDLTEQPQTDRATTNQETNEPPQTDLPTSQGNINQRILESAPQAQPQPQSQPRPQQAEPRVSDDALARLRREKQLEQQRETQERMEEARAQQQAEALKRVLQEDRFRYQPAETPLKYDNPLPSSADVDSFVQFDQTDWNYEPYKARMIRKLYEFWVPRLRQLGIFSLGISGRTVYRFEINKDGSLASISLVGESGQGGYDRAANFAIVTPHAGYKTSFPPLPLGFQHRTLGVTVGFFVNTNRPEN